MESTWQDAVSLDAGSQGAAPSPSAPAIATLDLGAAGSHGGLVAAPGGKAARNLQ
jgi:hypothetical protein